MEEAETEEIQKFPKIKGKETMEDEEMEPSLSNIPQEMINEVLKRLSVKSLCRFRCVSKSWLSLLSSPEFAKSHLHLALNNSTLVSQRRRIVFTSQNLYCVDYDSIASCDDDTDIVPVELDYPLKHLPTVKLSDYNDSEDEEDNPVGFNVEMHGRFFRNWVWVWGSCDGLLCFDPDRESLFLFNPCTGQSKRILHEWHYLCNFGFGYDSTTDDYKVVKIDIDRPSSVYSLRNDSWKEIDRFRHDLFFDRSGVFVRGAIYWIAWNRKVTDGQYTVISAFNLETEVFVDIPAPDLLSPSDFMLGALNENLCVLESFNEKDSGLWVIHEYGIDKSWAKITISLSYICLRPLCLAKNGEAIMEVDGELVQYNLEMNKYQVLRIPGIPINLELGAETYIESLISPNDYS